ncbi:UDP-N-acetylmuramate--L-alanine ligase [Myroides odoratimimus]|uniref:UDP-N-acetylmuramate--L-alanine ligase n=1 Tax=Myroides odoratimimus TaxID=76832 RepID=UPI001CE108E1|nr:UDP-N-acetylmuramate--L-alanine ligase [Myroides odoratimimus]MCA4791698.1 UDP-N-acetylmuramate--L-alanine ligase [Myroides odoratimimus]MCA4818959.1 UDP-N-acetylmuramate--L-alanine ligase [Myroides odoratimimus]MDM1057616.1 UDP-N-acetylmuramate--L-alanine ligase [Myroides odoratimimus]MDM1399287.1 UDP-N-acetylmuramate--L-alanine ligase [Myroides odoratimimus]MDM1448831.1 UDP-N-acetylmuramate--L-alanine ligase [Myroides odoratimimus]
MELSKIKSVFFIGIGGIGMSALARYFKFIGKNVAGYDRTATQLTDELKEAGIDIHFEDNLELVKDVYKDKETTLVVVTPAIPSTHTEWNFFIDNGFDIRKRSEVLGLITKDTYCFAVAGTHGKTTTTSILGHLLFQAGVDVTAFVGGVVENYQTNLIGSGKTVTVVEADEFDRSFLRLYPDTACITSTEADHLDIFGTAEEMLVAFQDFANKIEDKAKFFKTEQVDLNGIKVGFGEDCIYRIENISIDNGWYVFDIITPNERIEHVRFGLPGRHNLSNALVAFAMAYNYGIDAKVLVDGLGSFKGVRRRFSYKIRRDDLIYIDDYAHHPTEILAVSQAVHELYSDKKVVAVFQPHLYSRTRDFMSEFAAALSTFDHVVLLDIYPARELPIEGVTSAALLEQMTSIDKVVLQKGELLPYLKASKAELVLTIGAGDLGEMVEDIKKGLE